jgi:hypothetical protein
MPIWEGNVSKNTSVVRTIVPSIVLMLLLSGASIARADEIGTVTFSGVSSNCLFPVGPCIVPGPQETWNGTFSVDLNTGEILADSITGIGPGSGPWIGAAPGTFVNPDCLPGPPLRFGCSMVWSDAAGWSLQWDPGTHGNDLLHSAIGEFFGMSEFPSMASTYSVTISNTPEPPTIYLLCAGFLAILISLSRSRATGQTLA